VKGEKKSSMLSITIVGRTVESKSSPKNRNTTHVANRGKTGLRKKSHQVQKDKKISNEIKSQRAHITETSRSNKTPGESSLLTGNKANRKRD